MFTPTLTAVASDRVQQLRAEAQRDGAARRLRAARRTRRSAAR